MGVGRRTILFFKLQLQEDINFFACFPSPDILYSSSPESGDPDPRPDLFLVLVLLLQLLLLFSPSSFPSLPSSSPHFSFYFYSILLISCCSFPPPSSPLPSSPDLQRISSTFLVKNLGRSVVEIKQTLCSAFPTFSQSFFRAPPHSLICSHRKCFNRVEWSVRMLDLINCRVCVTIRTTLRRICLIDTAHQPITLLVKTQPNRSGYHGNQ